MKLILNSIAEEAAACRAAFRGVPVGALIVHCHHEPLFEFLSEPAENRIAYILHSKSQHEQALRLRLFRPVNIKLLPKKWQEAYAKWQEAYAKWQEANAKLQEANAKLQEANAKWQEANAKLQEAETNKLHARICKNCPWDEKRKTIF
jgi:hypothetical protein